jgi:hypothetical protein
MSLIPHITTILNNLKPELIDDSLSKTLSLLGNLVQLGQNYDDLYTFFYPNLQVTYQRMPLKSKCVTKTLISIIDYRTEIVTACNGRM